jgi:lipid-A-disaccharide synthase-like uncharacterized protein
VTPVPILAFQVWDAVGWVGQGIFTWRMLHQWWASERAGRSVVPTSFWWWSLAGTALLLVYQLHRNDPVFLAGVLVNGALYARNLVLALRGPRRTPARTGPLLPIGLALVLVAAITVLSLDAGRDVAALDLPPVWLAVGVAGQAVWSSRFVIQWWVSERRGTSVLPAAFFVASIAGAVLLCAYAVRRLDYVMIVAYALNPIPYVRNLVLIRRERIAERAPRPAG